MFSNLTALGTTIITLGIVVTIGVVVVLQVGEATTKCVAGGDISSNSSDKCINTTAGNTEGTTIEGSANSTAGYAAGQLGSSGLAGWIPAIIALAVGMLFLGALALYKGRSY